MDNISEKFFIITVKSVSFCNEGNFTLTSSVQDLPVILKWHNFQSLEKALNFLWNKNFVRAMFTF